MPILRTVSKLSKDYRIRAVGLLALGGVLFGIFTLYTRPDFLVLLANQVWACF
jgi:hypothetical protein